jgi:pimeloyl-ACP methyl ester carboxylesterase
VFLSIAISLMDGLVEASYSIISVDLKNGDQFNALDASKLQIPALILAREFDLIAPPEVQGKLYERIECSHKQYTSVPGGDHAAF